MTTPESLRRRAAVLVLEPWLSPEALSEALVLQLDTMRDNGVGTLIRYVDSLGERHEWDAALRKRLYAGLFAALSRPEGELPADPWPGGLSPYAARPPVEAVPTAPAPASMTVSPAAPVPPSGIKPSEPWGSAPVPVGASSPGPAVDPDAVAVFAALTNDVLAQAQRLHPDAVAEIARDMRERLGQTVLPQGLADAARQAWSNPLSSSWALSGDTAALRRLGGLLQDALIEAFGAAGTRQVLQRAIRTASSLPQARRCPPQELLRWL